MANDKNVKNDKNVANELQLQQMLAELAALKSQLAAVTAEKDAALAKAQRGGGRGRESLPEILGHNATSIMRSLVALGATGAEMNKALAAGYSIYASPSGMNTQISRVDKWLKATDKTAKEVKGFAPASLTREQVDELCDKAGIAKPTTLPDWCKQ